MDFKPGKGRKISFWRTLAEAEGLPEPKTPDEYADLFERWNLFGPAYNEYVEALKRLGYKLVNQDPDHCVCGARIQHKWLIVNHVSKLFAYIGSECKEKFGLPTPTSPRSALAQATFLVVTQIRELRRVGVEPKMQRWLLGRILYYREKRTKFKDSLIVTKKFANMLKLMTGIEWKWEVWESDQSKEKTNLRARKEKTASRQAQ